MRADSEHRGLRFECAGREEKIFSTAVVGQAFRDVGEKPTWAFDSKQPAQLKSGAEDFRAKIFRPMEISGGEVVGASGAVAMLAVV